MQDFAQQLARCAQSKEESVAFMEAFARVRLAGITKALSAPLAHAAAAGEDLEVDWNDSVLLVESGVDPVDVAKAVAAKTDPGRLFLHIEVALARSKATIATFLDMTGLSDKQKRDLYPWFSSQIGGGSRAELADEVKRLNLHLAWIRRTGVQPETFLAYHRHLGIHGSSQNFSGAVGAMGAAIAFIDAIDEISPGSIIEIVGTSPSILRNKSPEAIAEYLVSGTKTDIKAKQIKALVLNNERFVVFSSDPDVSIFYPLVQLPQFPKVAAPKATKNSSKKPKVPKPLKPLTRGEGALALYNQVRQHPVQRSQQLKEFAVGEVKTATDPSNLHERLALGSRETKVEVNADRFLFMALLTKDILEGGTGRKSGRAPLQNRDTVRFTDVFNLHHAWGWDGGRIRHPEHWETFKQRVRLWCGL
ncbi:hypothetical protein ACELLULO517_15925 [Acidisoma cellulosilytica]|uniref:Uncharacterized protein n=1 Tax=Acidisoma cellulosilyticum TaxID=2802395 RepID=A0A963Z2N3_9PROT|nr:hypothetical protein [Acidisoma cellulosilyticum]MCB8881737.1 hypothetical protein [Acidisoma cellulosilyticum]